MTPSPDPLAPARALAAVLREENAALAARDLAAATALLARKQAAADAFAARPAVPPGTPGAAALAAELRDLAAENRKLLERAMFVQRRVIEIVARAARGHSAAPRYGRRGSQLAEHRAPAFALHAKA
jgi:hypothetical protein